MNATSIVSYQAALSVETGQSSQGISFRGSAIDRGVLQASRFPGLWSCGCRSLCIAGKERPHPRLRPYGEIPQALGWHAVKASRRLLASMLAPLIGELIAVPAVPSGPYRLCNQGRQVRGRLVEYLEFRDDELLHDPIKTTSLHAAAMRAPAAVFHVGFGANMKLLALADIYRRAVGMVAMAIGERRVANRINYIAAALSQLSDPLDFRFHPEPEFPKLWIANVTDAFTHRFACPDSVCG